MMAAVVSHRLKTAKRRPFQRSKTRAPPPSPPSHAHAAPMRLPPVDGQQPPVSRRCPSPTMSSSRRWRFTTQAVTARRVALGEAAAAAAASNDKNCAGESAHCPATAAIVSTSGRESVGPRCRQKEREGLVEGPRDLSNGYARQKEREGGRWCRRADLCRQPAWNRRSDRPDIHDPFAGLAGAAGAGPPPLPPTCGPRSGTTRSDRVLSGPTAICSVCVGLVGGRQLFAGNGGCSPPANARERACTLQFSDWTTRLTVGFRGWLRGERLSVFRVVPRSSARAPRHGDAGANGR